MPRVEISKKLVLINSASSAGVMLLNVTVLVWLQQYLIKRISAEEYALLPLVMSVMAFAPMITIVLTSALGRYVTVAYAKGDEQEVTSICSTMLPILAGTGVLLMLAGGAVIWQIDRLLMLGPSQRPEAQLMLGILFFSVAIRLPMSAFASGFVVRQKLMLQDMIAVACQLLRLALLFGLLFGAGTRVLWVVTATAISELVSVLVGTVVSLRLVPAQRFSLASIRWPLAKELVGYGGWAMVGQAVKTAQTALAPLLLNRFAGAMDVATFHVAGIAPRQLTMVMAPITRPFIPLLAAFDATEDDARMRSTYLRTARYHSWALLTIAVPAMVFAEEVMNLYLGGRYPDAGNTMTVLLIVPVLGALNALGPYLALARGKIRAHGLRQLVVMTFHVGMALLMIAFLQQGAVGAAIAAAVTRGVADAGIQWTFAWQLTKTPFTQWLRQVLAPTFTLAVPHAGFCLLAKLLLPLDGWLSVFGISAVSALLFVTLVLFFGLQEQDRADIHRLAERLPQRLGRILNHFGTRPVDAK